VAGTLVVESAMFVAGLWLYLSTTRALDGIGRYGLAALIGLLVVIYLGAAFGPPPPSEQAIALSMLPAIVLALWAAWVDRHRARYRPSHGAG
jgi:FtsH-binding integral membrane protein